MLERRCARVAGTGPLGRHHGVTFKSLLLWTQVLALSVACGQRAQHAEAPPPSPSPSPSASASPPARPGVLQEELALLAQDYSFNASRCIRTAEEVVDMQRRCSEENWADCVYAGTMYSEGCGVAQDRLQAEALHQRACDFGSVLGCATAGIITKDLELGMNLLEKPCVQGYVQACGSLGIKLLARGKEADVERATELLDQACRKDTRYYCGVLGEIVSKRKIKPRFKATRALLERACEARDLKACETLAKTLEDGSLGTVDHERAADLNATLCYELDHLPACNSLGLMAVLGRGGDKNALTGTWLFYNACNRGYGPACDSMGEAMANGWVGRARPGAALAFYDRGCKMGSQGGCQGAEALRAAGFEPAVAGGRALLSALPSGAKTHRSPRKTPRRTQRSARH
jgi:TPR repeat protein